MDTTDPADAPTTATIDPAELAPLPPRQTTSGWVLFAATVVFTVALANGLYGITLIAGDDWVVITPERLVRFNSNAVGTIYLIFAAVGVAIGFGILRGRLWARVLGIAGAVLNGLAQMAFLAAYPTWSIIVMVIDLVIIYALTVHGDDVAPI